MSIRHDLILYAGGDDPRILELPSLLGLPAEDNHGPHEQETPSGDKIKACGVRIADNIVEHGKASNRLHAWLDGNRDLLQSLDIPYKWIRVLIHTQGESAFGASPSLMQKLIDCGLTLEVTVVAKEL